MFVALRLSTHVGTRGPKQIKNLPTVMFSCLISIDFVSDTQENDNEQFECRKFSCVLPFVLMSYLPILFSKQLRTFHRADGDMSAGTLKGTCFRCVGNEFGHVEREPFFAMRKCVGIGMHFTCVLVSRKRVWADKRQARAHLRV